MYEDYYGLSEKPFSLTPDPRYLYKSESHANALELLQYAIRRREGFAVVTGDIGTGKTTLCRALLEKIDRNVFTALVLNPFLSEEDLLRLILVDFGVVSREQVKQGRLNRVSKQELIDALYDFLLGLLPLNSAAVLIVDEAQNLPYRVLEQLRILSNLETDKAKLLQIVLVGQLNLRPMLRSPELRQLDQRVAIRCELQPLTRVEVTSYVSHRLSVAGGGGAVTFQPQALDRIHDLSRGIPRLVNLICDRSLLEAYTQRTTTVTREVVARAADALDVARPPLIPRFAWFRKRARAMGTAAMLLLALVATLALVLLGPIPLTATARHGLVNPHAGVAVAGSPPAPRTIAAPGTAFSRGTVLRRATGAQGGSRLGG